VTANSEAVAAQTASSEGYAWSQIHVIHNALDPSFGSGIDLAPETTGPVVGIVANIRPVKRIGDAVEALALIGAEFSSARLRIVGGGDPGPIRHAAVAFGVEDRVEFAGPSEEPAAEMRGFTIGLLTSETEGFSNTLMEYQQLGVPVIASDGGGNPELVRDAVTGLVYPVGDVHALAAGIRLLLGDERLRDRLGRAGRAAVRELCDPERTLREYQGLYDCLILGLEGSVTADTRQL
jgi:glycosyltransferase involved in cell wall biosynthesis